MPVNDSKSPPVIKPVIALLLLSSFAAEQHPNILLFLADDLSYADNGMNGCKGIPTPNIDCIAKNGVRFTDGYTTHPVCSHSLAGLMSGMCQHRFAFEHNSGPQRFADPNFGMSRKIPSLAEKLKGAGYATGMMGKWHIGFEKGLRPRERGFDCYFGFFSGTRSYYPDNPRETDPLIRNGEVVKAKKYYLTDAFARAAADFIQRSKDAPWLVYSPLTPSTRRWRPPRLIKPVSPHHRQEAQHLRRHVKQPRLRRGQRHGESARTRPGGDPPRHVLRRQWRPHRRNEQPK